MSEPLTWPEWEAAEKFGAPRLWASTHGNQRQYGCAIELPCPIPGGEVKVCHFDKTPILAIIGATDKARQMTALPAQAPAERLGHAAQ